MAGYTYSPYVVRPKQPSRADYTKLLIGVLAGGLALSCSLVALSVSNSASSSSVSLGSGAGGWQRNGHPNGRMSYLSSLQQQQLAEDGNATDTVDVMNSTAANATREDGAATAESECAAVQERHAFFVKQLFWSWVNTLEVSGVTKHANGSKSVGQLGLIQSTPFSFVSEQEWRDEDGNLIASSHQDAITTITNIYVEDCHHNPMATVSEKMAGTSSGVSEYTIENSDGDIVALSTMSRSFGTEVDINDQQTGKRLVTVAKGWGQWSDAWAATFRSGVSAELANDPRVVVMLLSAASSKGTWGLGGPASILLNPLWLLMLFCCCCACCTAISRNQESVEDHYERIDEGFPAPTFSPGRFSGQGSTLGGVTLSMLALVLSPHLFIFGRNSDNIVRC